MRNRALVWWRAIFRTIAGGQRRCRKFDRAANDLERALARSEGRDD